MAQSSDELIKREIIEATKFANQKLNLRIFPQSSNQDQELFSKGGLTFGENGTLYGSCDAVWYENSSWVDGFDNKVSNLRPVIALEGTDALSRGSSGNAQYQRFHHALGAVRNGILGIYYFRPGDYPIQQDLYGMAVNASKIERGQYLIINDLKLLFNILRNYGTINFKSIINQVLVRMEAEYLKSFEQRYANNWDIFAKNRSSIIGYDYVIKHAARNYRNFTDSSQRAGHIAVGEMYLTKYLVNKKNFYYLFPRLTRSEVVSLDNGKKTDKEWRLLRSEPNVTIVSRDELQGVSTDFMKVMEKIADKPLKGEFLKIYKNAMDVCFSNIREGKWKIMTGGFHGSP